MSDVKWIKIVTDIFDDEKILLIEQLPDADSVIVIWFKLLCLAGKQNNSGVFMVGSLPCTDEMLAAIFRRPLNTVKLALSTFEKLDMIEVVNNCITIPKWGKYQNLEGLESRREYMREYMKEYRNKQKMLSDGREEDVNIYDVNGVNTDKHLVSTVDKNRLDKNREDKNKNTECASDTDFFDEFWKAYPRKVSKQSALKAWKGAKADKLAEQIIADVQRRCETEWKGQEMQYIPFPTTYLHQRRWEDETAPQERRTTQKPEPKPNAALNYEQRTYDDDEFQSGDYMREAEEFMRKQKEEGL